jgi:hypothetical protein
MPERVLTIEREREALRKFSEVTNYEVGLTRDFR